jgi:hypothetical protein
MKLAVTLAVLAATGCSTVLEDAATTDTATADQSAIVLVPAGLPRVNTSCQWSVDTTCYGQRNDGNNIWPSGMGINRVFVLTRSGPTRLEGKQQTYLAFVVWNDAVVGRIFRLDLGSSDAVNFNNTLSNTFYVKTFGPDLGAGSAGSTYGSPGTPPHPNVNDPIVFDTGYLGSVVNSAAMLDRVTTDFLATRSLAIDP